MEPMACGLREKRLQAKVRHDITKEEFTEVASTLDKLQGRAFAYASFDQLIQEAASRAEAHGKVQEI